MIRIVGGSAKGRKLKLPPGDVRPATSRVRQSIFNYLSDVIPDSSVLDLYCGSGGLGFEALSRGAKNAWFVDISRRVIEVCRENSHNLNFNEKCLFSIRDVFQFLKRDPDEIRFHVIFASPPYKISEPFKILEHIRNGKVLESSGCVCIEYDRHTEMPDPPGFILDRRKQYGETIVDIWDKI